MKPETLTALLALWGRLPESRPDTLFVAGDSNGGDKVICVVIASDGRKVLIPDYSPQAISAIAADAIERWMLGKRANWSILYDDGSVRICDGSESFGSVCFACETDKLTALISAANAVLDAEGKGT